MAAYVIRHGLVGPHRQGEVVDEAVLRRDALGRDIPDFDLDRLIGLGAIQPKEDYDLDQQALARLTLSEHQRSDSPATLPVVPADVETTVEEVAHVLNPSDTFSGGELPLEGPAQRAAARAKARPGGPQVASDAEARAAIQAQEAAVRAAAAGMGQPVPRGPASGETPPGTPPAPPA